MRARLTPRFGEAELQAAFQARQWPKVSQLCEKIIRKDRRSLLAHRYLGFALKEQGEIGRAIESFSRAVAVFPADAEILANYTALLLEQQRASEALPLLEKLCGLRPLDSLCWNQVAQACYPLGLNEKGFGSAMVAYGLARTDLERANALTQRAIHRRELGQIRAAVEDCSEVIALFPESPVNHTNRLLFMLADPQTAPTELTAAAKAFAEVFEPPHKPHWPSYAERAGDPWRKLKIGFLSPDFRIHAVMVFAEGILAQLDRRQFEVFAFYLHPSEDHVTQRVKCHVDHFIRLNGMDYDAQANCIRQHAIDILVDMTGHTGGNALLTMVRKPAPVQVTWLGFVGTTGLSSIDYYLTDSCLIPPECDHLYTEKVYRMPTSAASYRALSRNPLWRYQPLYAVRPTPALKNGFITFGSCNNLGKLTDEVLSLWAQILAKVPDSRLLIEGKGFVKQDFADEYKARCRNLGIDSDRLILVPMDTKNQYLTYHDIDIALDPFPLNGGTTTCDTLWMGVPLVAIAGSSPPSRMSMGVMTAAGVTDWLVADKEAYLTKAIDLSKDYYQLENIRNRLRDRFEASPVMQDEINVEQFTSAFRTMWFTWQSNLLHPHNAQSQENEVSTWLGSKPHHLEGPAPLRVGLASGEALSLEEAHQRLQDLVTQALAIGNNITTDESRGMGKDWVAVTEFAELVLSAVPNDALALACLAEVEHAHGHTDFAVTYLQYATKALAA